MSTNGGIGHIAEQPSPKREKRDLTGPEGRRMSWDDGMEWDEMDGCDGIGRDGLDGWDGMDGRG